MRVYLQQQLDLARDLPNITEAILSALEHAQPELLPALVDELVGKAGALQMLIRSQRLQAQVDAIVEQQEGR